MNKQKKIGIIFIIIGICIPLLAFPFITSWSKEKSIYSNFYEAGIQIKKNTEITNPKAGTTKETNKKKITFSELIPSTIPFRYFLAIMVFFIFIGIVKIDSSRKDKSKIE